MFTKSPFLWVAVKKHWPCWDHFRFCNGTIRSHKILIPSADTWQHCLLPRPRGRSACSQGTLKRVVSAASGMIHEPMYATISCFILGHAPCNTPVGADCTYDSMRYSHERMLAQAHLLTYAQTAYGILVHDRRAYTHSRHARTRATYLPRHQNQHLKQCRSGRTRVTATLKGV